MSTSFLSTGYLQAPARAGAKEVAGTSITSTSALPLPNLFLTLKVQEAFAAEPALQNAPIVIDVSAGVVHLSGAVRARYQQVIATHVARGVRGVHAICNRIQFVPTSGTIR